MQKTASRIALALSFALALALPASASAAPDQANRPAVIPAVIPEVIPAVDLLAPLTDSQGRVLSDTPGGTVTVRAAGKPFVLEDGEAVTYLSDNGAIGIYEKTVAKVIARKKKVTVPSGRIIVEHRLHRSPDRKWAIFSPMVDCEDFCTADGWLLGPGVRVRLAKGDFAADADVAWRADGKQVAIGSGNLFLVSLPDGAFTKADGFTAPAYAANGRLYVRANGSDDAASDAVFEWNAGGKPRKVLAMAGSRPASDGGDWDRGDPDPVTFEADGAIIATFERGDETRQRMLPAAGGDLAGTPMPPPPAVAKALAAIVDSATSPAAAAAAASAGSEKTPTFAHDLAVAANTRGYRLYQDGKLDDAIPLFKAALNADVTYGMPRYNLARVYARQGNTAQSVVYLRMLRIMGKAQRARLEQAGKDEAFKRIVDSDEFRAVFK